MNERAFSALKESSIFCGLSDVDLTELVNTSEVRWASAGECLINSGDQGESMFIVLSGELEVHRETTEGETLLATIGPGSFAGEMSLIDNAPRTATVRASSDSEVLEITRIQFDQLLDSSSEACRALLRTVLRRLKSTEAMLVNQEKMAALGRISAGLAHELNNPASAVSRFAFQLESNIRNWQDSAHALSGENQRNLLHRYEDLVSPSGDGRKQRLSALELSTREESLAEWLSSNNVPDAWTIAANFARAGLTRDSVEHATNDVTRHELPTALNWLGQQAAIQTTLGELRASADRVSEIVDSVKRYSHMDRAPIERLNVNQGIETTLVILRHKSRGIDLDLDLDPELPEITGFPAELSQVWTNLVDNALDAMHGSGLLTVRTEKHPTSVVVSISDTGSGIPAELQGRVFEPFFTTKEVGLGTGLGLHIVHNIVVQRHGGTIEFDTGLSGTTFRVTLPIDRQTMHGQ